MRIEVSIAKTTALPNGALEALNNELSRRIAEQFPAIDSQVSVRYATGNQLSVFGALKEDKDRISEILQESGYLYFGNPVKQIRPLTEAEREGLKYSANNYVKWKNEYLDQDNQIQP